ncbi:MAG: carboxypeptidase regulatory-like domain-containing protein [Planctomycetes bacterium]|nr:carboxypeptidase regulatory-like domain-containing protein [Planctomycetota bacterium]
MNARVFIVLVCVVAAVIGLAMFSLRDGGSEPVDVVGTEDASGGGAAAVEASGAPDPDVRAPVEVQPGDERPEREAAVGTTEFDPAGALEVTGRVVDAASREPIKEAEVEIFYADGEDSFGSATTAEDGGYRLVIADGIPGMIDLRAYASDYSAQAQRGLRVDASTRALAVDFELRRAFRVEGYVRQAADGSPVAGADLEIRSRLPLFSDEWNDAETDATGHYEFTDIEEIPPQGFDIWVDSVDHAPMVKYDLAVPEGADVLQVDFTLWSQLLIRGSVVSSVSGGPIEDAMVSACSPDPEFVDDGEDELTDEDGAFALELDCIPYHDLFLLVSADDHSPVRINPVPLPDQHGVIELGKVTLGPLVRLSGVVVNKATGLPVTGGDITFFDAAAPDTDEGEFCDAELIDESGRFEVDLEMSPPASAAVLIEATGCFPLRLPLQVPLNTRLHEVRFEVEAVIVLRGTVRRTADSSPLAGARIRLLGGSEADGEGPLLGRTRADGTFLLELPASAPEDLGVVIEYGEYRFSMGRLPRPGPGSAAIVQDYAVDVAPLRRRN